MKTNNKELIEWNYENSLFGKLHNMGINSAVISSFLKYCENLEQLNYCKSPNRFYWFTGISEIFSIIKKLKAFDNLFIYSKITTDLLPLAVQSDAKSGNVFFEKDLRKT